MEMRSRALSNHPSNHHHPWPAPMCPNREELTKITRDARAAKKNTDSSLHSHSFIKLNGNARPKMKWDPKNWTLILFSIRFLILLLHYFWGCVHSFLTAIDHTAARWLRFKVVNNTELWTWSIISFYVIPDGHKRHVAFTARYCRISPDYMVHNNRIRIRRSDTESEKNPKEYKF